MTWEKFAEDDGNFRGRRWKFPLGRIETSWKRTEASVEGNGSFRGSEWKLPRNVPWKSEALHGSSVRGIREKALSVDPFRTAVSLRGQTAEFLSWLSLKGDRGTKREELRQPEILRQKRCYLPPVSRACEHISKTYVGFETRVVGRQRRKAGFRLKALRSTFQELILVVGPTRYYRVGGMDVVRGREARGGGGGGTLLARRARARQ